MFLDVPPVGYKPDTELSEGRGSISKAPIWNKHTARCRTQLR